MALAYVGSTAGTTSGNSSATTVTVTRTTTAGNLLLLIVAHGGTVTGVTDTASNTGWSMAVDSGLSGSPSTQRTALWICPSASAVTSVTATYDTAGLACATLVEISGAHASAPLVPLWTSSSSAPMAVAYPASGTTQNITSTSMSLPANCALIVGYAYNSTVSGTRQDSPGSGFTAVTGGIDGTFAVGGAYEITSFLTSVTPSVTMSVANRISAFAVMIRPPLTAAGGTFATAPIATTSTSSGGSGSGGGTSTIPTTGQLWPRGNLT